MRPKSLQESPTQLAWVVGGSQEDTWEPEVAQFYARTPGFPLYDLGAYKGEDPATILVDYFYSIEDYKHVVVHLGQLLQFNPDLLSDIAEQMDVNTDYVLQTCAEAAAEEWASWELQDANNINFRLPRLLDTYAAVAPLNDGQDIANLCQCRLNFRRFEDPQQVVTIIEDAMDYWGIIKRIVTPPMPPTIG